VGRPHSPIDPQQPLADFASGLLALKIGSKLTYKQMRQKEAFCESVLSEAASGKHARDQLGGGRLGDAHA
jgi:hypothetical protein